MTGGGSMNFHPITTMSDRTPKPRKKTFDKESFVPKDEATHERDAELIASIQAGDQRALTAYIRSQRRYLTTVIQNACTEPGTDAVDEVISHAMLKLYTEAKAGTLVPGGVDAWLSRVARNRAIDRRRGDIRRKGLLEKYQKSVPPDDHYMPAPHNQDLLDLIRGLLDILSDTERVCITACFITGMTQIAAAESLGMSQGTLKGAVRRGLMKLKGLAETQQWCKELRTA